MFKEILEKTFWNNTVMAYLISILILITGIITIKIFKHSLLKRLKAWAEKTATQFDDFLINVICHIALPLAYLVILYVSINTLKLNEFLKQAINFLGMALLTIMSARFAVVLAAYGFKLYWEKRGKDAGLERNLNGILRVLKLFIWSLAIVFFLDNLGFEISAVIASLGIGGVAVALAAQAVLGDLFSYFAILFDRPFELGDFIIIGEYLGTIEHIGIKTTRIRSLGGEQLIFSNTDLTNSRVRNYKRMDKRRVVFKLGVTYQTTLDNLKAIPKIIENIIKNTKDTVFDRAHFFSYGDFSLIYEVVYYVLGSDYNKYMDIQQEINFSINEEFKKKNIEFAYPTQTLFVNKSGK
ncbi:MAG: mechanosensitive ion channel family protein [Candidatus Omnitrophota bacterium]|nr:MAG: mechanosensitive ion channel family protein [Candidatus Omnitrophota bacterium]